MTCKLKLQLISCNRTAYQWSKHVYSPKTLDQLPLFLKEFRKAKELTQVDMAGRLGITQQGYAHLEVNPAGKAFPFIALNGC